MKKVLALDIGDQWTGSALSDRLRYIAKPYITISTAELIPFLTKTFAKEQIEIVVIGHPITLKGKESEQTKKIISFKETLEIEFPHMSWVLWDERFSSQQADMIKKNRTKEEKLHAHSIAAAFILERYLDYLRAQIQ
jgi:putative Holliday junction resolvase